MVEPMDWVGVAARTHQAVHDIAKVAVRTTDTWLPPYRSNLRRIYCD